MILVKEFASSPSSLGAANGLAQFSQCLARAVAPAFVRYARHYYTASHKSDFYSQLFICLFNEK